MQVTAKIVNDIMYLNLLGELDQHTAKYARDMMDELLDNGGFDKIIVDLAGLNFMDSTGIGVMIGRYKKMKVRGKPIFVTNPSKQIDRIFLMTALYDVMPKID